jgi:glycosyltransferase involved in cell wall biosynthesis
MLLPSLQIGGMEMITAHLAAALAVRGVDVGITCAYRGGELDAYCAAVGIRMSVLPVESFRRDPLSRPLVRHINQRRPDILHSHTGNWSRAAMVHLQSRARAHVHSVHGLGAEVSTKDVLLMRVASAFTDALIPVSESLRRFLQHRVRVPAHRMTVIENGVDANHFAPGLRSPVWRAERGIAPDVPLIGIVARLAPVKDVETLLRAFAGVLARGSNAQLVVAGDGPSRDALQSLARELGIADAVHFLGMATDTAAVYRELDVFVLSSRSEGTSISLLEAMASGVPAVATAVGGNVDMLAHGERGMLVPSADPDALGAALWDALHDRARALRVAERARDHVVRELSIEAMCARTLGVYESVLRAVARSRGPQD